MKLTNKEAIKYLKQLYPNGGHCWLDEQRIEAIGMAISALECKCTEEPISKDLEEAAESFLKENWDVDNIYEEDDLGIRNSFKAGAQWQEKQLINKVCEWITEELIDARTKNNSFGIGREHQLSRLKEKLETI